VATSLRFGVLCRFTAFVAVDSRVIDAGGELRRVTQPVELPSGWDAPGTAMPAMMPLTLGSVEAVSAPVAAPMPQRFAPTRAQAADLPAGFAAVPPAMRRAGRAHVRPKAGPTVQDLRDLARLEADRLAEGRDRPAYERRDMLADLVSRLEVLLGGVTDPAYAPLRELLAFLTGDAGLDRRWDEARRVLTDFAGGTSGPDPAPRDRRAFWKR
jgi:Ca-activated chloride channel family protein